MDASYSEDRKRKPGHAFNLRMRTQVVLHALTMHYAKSCGLDILDLGSADGLTLRELDVLLKGCRYWGVEYSAELIQAAGELPNSITLMQGDAASLPDSIASRNYDVVTALALLEHLDDPDAAVQGAAAVLKQGGLFIATSPSPLWDALAGMFGLIPGKHHVRKLNASALRTLVIKAGLRPLTTLPFMFAPIACLPYVGISIKPECMLSIDLALSAPRLLNPLFANTAIIAMKD